MAVDGLKNLDGPTSPDGWPPVGAGRPKSFDEREVLGRAMEVFWLRGYEGVGLTELLGHMGISRQSLYDTFGSKRGLFVRTIEHYRETQLSRALALLAREDTSPLENVREVVRFFEGLAGHESRRGCLVANALVELGPHDEDVAALLNDTLGLLQQSIEDALRQARERGELADSKSPETLARALTNALMGMVVTGKLPGGSASLRAICTGTLSMLD